MKRGGGVMILVSDKIPSKLSVSKTASNDSFNVCAIVTGCGDSKMLVIVVYRAPWASMADTGDLCNTLDDIVIKYTNVVIVGDFNIPRAQWQPGQVVFSGPTGLLHNLASAHNLTQLARQPTRDASLLDLIFVSSAYISSTVTDLPPIGDSDHSAQLLHLPLAPVMLKNDKMVRKVDLAILNNLLQPIDWLVAFAGCNSTNDYAERFTNVLRNAITASTYYRPRTRFPRLPRHIVQLIKAKKKAWLRSRRTGNRQPFITARRIARAAIRAHVRNTEQRLIYDKNRAAFYSHIYNNTGKRQQAISLSVGDEILSDEDAADAFRREFSLNFSSDSNAPLLLDNTNATSSEPNLVLNCSEVIVLEALARCPNTDSSPDGVSFKLLKSVARHIVRPLNIVYQHSLFEGTFPVVWKHAIIIPLYKGKGDRSSASSYRPISLCSCLGKLLEKIVHKQLLEFLANHCDLHPAQHGFTAGKSTLTNLLQFDAYVSDCISSNHAYDIIAFDFCKAFDKAPHQSVINAASSNGIKGTALKWLACFLTYRTQQVKVGKSLSTTSKVVSGVVQGSVLGPVLFVILTNSLLHSISLPLTAFADDLKLCADVTVHDQHAVQREIDKVANWAEQNSMPLSVQKSAVMHCGKRQPYHNYILSKQPMATADSITDLGVIRTTAPKYSEHCQAVALKAAKTANAICRAFRCRAKELMWPAFSIYVLPIITYCSPVWNPAQQCDIAAIERVQRKFTKRISGLRALSYGERLQHLGAVSLQRRRQHTDMLTMYKILHGNFGCTPSQLGITLASSSTRGQGVHAIQRRAISSASSSLFQFRGPSNWNKIPINITSSLTLNSFKKLLCSAKPNEH
jgi:ribonuclease P/MRP protein subunit RPP40